ncbi:MAG: hypothetical protein BWY46_01333 [Firmicutes bacterium ADurb.Bin300]|nr:MAG: hypothetical protein BWY46_01333 [Firmicutes bacterium ADurb.Bin300]
MSAFNSLLFILLSTFAMSYAWGMRGTTIGGEKGAMLPGAVMGLLIAMFSGNYLLFDNFFFLSALGSTGMYYGGCMTYGETLGLSMNSKPALNMKKGLIALFVKGFLWFAVFAQVLSLGLASLTGKYFSVREVIIMFLLMPVVMITFLFIFNRPHNTEKSVFPKIYFSITRKESWGALLGLFFELLLISIIKKIPFAVEYTFICGLFGAVGWVVAQLMQIFCRQYSKDCRGSFLKLWSKPSIGAWKVMECILGAFGGLGASVGIVMFFDKFVELTAQPVNRFWTPLGDKDRLFVYAYIAILAIDMIHYFSKSKKLQIAAEILEFPFYSTIPMLLVFFGSKDIAQISSFFILYWVFVQEVSFEKPHKLKYSAVFKILFTAIGIIILTAQLLFNYLFGLRITVLLYGVFYEVFTLAYLLPRYDKASAEKYNNSFMNYLFKTEIGTVHIYFIVCVLVFTLYVFLY